MAHGCEADWRRLVHGKHPLLVGCVGGGVGAGGFGEQDEVPLALLFFGDGEAEGLVDLGGGEDVFYAVGLLVLEADFGASVVGRGDDLEFELLSGGDLEGDVFAFEEGR